MAHLLDLVLVRVPAPVLRTRFSETARVLMAVVEAADGNVRFFFLSFSPDRRSSFFRPLALTSPAPPSPPQQPPALRHAATCLATLMAAAATDPAAATTPAASCPSAMGTGRGRSPLMTDRSEWHRPAAAIRTSTSPWRGGASSSSASASGCDCA